ncbi:MAG: DNA mismatch repair endonuclease MutL, partial [Sulfurihydrogenibium sp.]|uniref:DNA mismatch repair endonuclease MutL n=1 Tax=Sulfurihydrogenibium sp. TaxID=2053621 RepID=UPI003D0FD7CF
MKIKPLSEEVINKIAAGEVVERPASVLKELIENSLDASATSLEVYIEKAGKRLICVVDNGEGIEKEDILNAVKRHYTSKIRTEEDLYSILSYGFRGEALSSISAVSKLTITSRTKNDIYGNQVVVEGGNLISLSQVGCPVGTKVEVKDLFYNVPARQKFLKSENTENLHNVWVFINYALSNPEKHFKLVIDSKETFNLYPSSLKERVSQIYGKKYLEDLKFIEYENYLGKVYGFVSLGNVKTRKSHIFINKRPVKNALISSVMKKKIGDNFFILFFELPPYFIDVNVHPSKQEVKFRKENVVVDLIESALKENLNEFKTFVVSYQELRQNTAQYQTKNGKFEILGQIEDTFIVAYSESHVYFIDQHVANERVMYEILLNQLKENKKIPSQRLLSPFKLHLSPSQVYTLNEMKETIERIGFVVENKESQYFLTAIPYNLETSKAVEVFYEVLESYPDTSNEKLASSLSCRMSITAGDRLTLEKAKQLIQEWIKTENPNVCPHGRPIYYKVSLDEIKKAVGRK